MYFERLIVVICLAFLPSFAFAYIDPGSTTIIFQAIVAAIAGGLAFGRLYWVKIKYFFSSNKNKVDTSAANTVEEDDLSLK